MQENELQNYGEWGRGGKSRPVGKGEGDCPAAATCRRPRPSPQRGRPEEGPHPQRRLRLPERLPPHHHGGREHGHSDALRGLSGQFYQRRRRGRRLQRPAQPTAGLAHRRHLSSTPGREMIPPPFPYFLKKLFPPFPVHERDEGPSLRGRLHPGGPTGQGRLWEPERRRRRRGRRCDREAKGRRRRR